MPLSSHEEHFKVPGGCGRIDLRVRTRFAHAGLLFLDPDTEAECERAAAQSSSGAIVLTVVIVCNVAVAAATVCVWDDAWAITPEWTTGVGLAFSLLAMAVVVVGLAWGYKRGSHMWIAADRRRNLARRRINPFRLLRDY